MAGCPFGPSFPGWRILVEAFYNPVPGRTYGSLNFGDQVYGDVNNAGPLWVDITTPAFDITLTVGASTPDAPVPVTELVVELHDDTGTWWDFAAPARYNLPFMWSPIRVSLIDPAAVTHRLAYGRVEEIADPHTKPPRLVTVTAYGNVSTLVTAKAGWQRPAETSHARVAALVAAASAASTIPVSIVPVRTVNLLADANPSTVVIRDELDRTAASAGWIMYEDTAGTVMFRDWPLAATGAQIVATDCIEADNADALLAPGIDYVANTASLLNRAEATNTANALASSSAPFSAALYDWHSQAYGYPQSGLAFANAADAQLVTNRAVARWSNVVNHVDAVAVDTAADRRWLAVLAGLTHGRPLRLDRRGIRPFILDTIVTGWQHHLTKDRCQTDIYTTTITPTG